MASFKQTASTKRSAGSTDPRIDVMIPAIEKDLGTLPHVIDGIRKQVKHPIGSFMIVSPDSERIKALCRKKGCRFVNERTVLPIGKKDIRYGSKRWNRAGWLYQQLLKLGGSKLGDARHYLVADADTVLIRPHRFMKGGRPIFYCRGWSQGDYFRTYRKLLGSKASAPRSFVTHYMLFDKSKVSQLKRKIEARHGKRWYKAIIGSIDRTKQFGFSEFETYGNFLHSRNPRGIVMKSALNKSLHTDFASLSPARIKRLAGKYRSLSFHKRKIYARPGV